MGPTTKGDIVSSKLKEFDRCIMALQASTDPTIPSQMMRTFIAVCENEGKSMTELAEVVGANVSTMSRHLLDLGPRNRKMEPGYGLIESRTDPMNLRVKCFFLTPKGKLALRNIERD
jgi:DNA-binding MarR family transcriptional regulator